MNDTSIPVLNSSAANLLRPSIVSAGTHRHCWHQLPQLNLRESTRLIPSLTMPGALYEKQRSSGVKTCVISGLTDTRQVSSMSGLSKESVQREMLISEAETALAWQTTSTYRRWFSSWRGRGVGANDLLNMTWVWRQRSSD